MVVLSAASLSPPRVGEAASAHASPGCPSRDAAMRAPWSHRRFWVRTWRGRLRAHALLGRLLPRLGPPAAKLGGLFRSEPAPPAGYETRTGRGSPRQERGDGEEDGQDHDRDGEQNQGTWIAPAEGRFARWSLAAPHRGGQGRMKVAPFVRPSYYLPSENEGVDIRW